MKNIARLPDEERANLFRNTADKMKLHDAIVEKDFYLSGWNLPLKEKSSNIKSIYYKKVARKMKVRFTAEIIDDNGNTLKTPVSVETKVPDLTDFNCPSKFLKVFDQYERPVIEARNQIASEITKDYLEEAAFLKDRKCKP